MKKLVAFSILFLLNYTLIAQKFVPAFDTFSHRKIAYVTLSNGTEITGKIRKIKRKKGGLKKIKVKEESGKTKFKAKDVAHMYLPAHIFDRIEKAVDAAFDVTTYDRLDLNMKIIDDGYGYFETTPAFKKENKKKRDLMMQLVNPHTSGEIKIYDDPFAKNTMKMGIGYGLSIGGLEKSYYVKKGDKTAVRVKKATFQKEYSKLFGDCPELMERKVDVWSKFDETVKVYNDFKRSNGVN